MLNYSDSITATNGIILIDAVSLLCFLSHFRIAASFNYLSSATMLSFWMNYVMAPRWETDCQAVTRSCLFVLKACYNEYDGKIDAIKFGRLKNNQNFNAVSKQSMKHH